MFTFLSEDEIPWNNNAAERAPRHLAVQRKISGDFSEKGARRYLRLAIALAEATETNRKAAGVFLDTLSSIFYRLQSDQKNGEFVVPWESRSRRGKLRTGL
jgi:Transposase IS66 family